MLNFTHHAVHGGDKLAEVKWHSEQMLGELEKEYPDVFTKPTYSIREHRQLFQIPLIDTSKQIAHRHLHPLSIEELTLKKQINQWLETGQIVPSISLYGHPVLFAKKKGGGVFHLCIDYYSLNANTMVNAQPLLCIDNLLSRLKGARVFSSLALRDRYHQLLIDHADHHKTEFACRYGQLEYTVMSFRFKNALAHF